MEVIQSSRGSSLEPYKPLVRYIPCHSHTRLTQISIPQMSSRSTSFEAIVVDKINRTCSHSVWYLNAGKTVYSPCIALITLIYKQLEKTISIFILNPNKIIFIKLNFTSPRSLFTFKFLFRLNLNNVHHRCSPVQLYL